MESFTYLPENIPSGSLTNTFVDCIRDYFLFQHITEPTRFRKGQNPTLDDLIFTNESEMLELLKYLAPPGGNDHAAHEFNFIFSIISTNLNRTVLLYDKGDYEKIKQLFNEDCTEVLQSMKPHSIRCKKVYTRQLSYEYHQKSLLMLVASNHCG